MLRGVVMELSRVHTRITDTKNASVAINFLGYGRIFLEKIWDESLPVPKVRTGRDFAGANVKLLCSCLAQGTVCAT